MAPEMREVVADNMKERVYSTLTLLALLAVMWENPGHRSTLGTIGNILVAAVALWAATLISARLSYRAVHGKPISRRGYVRAFFTSSGLLVPIVPPILIIAASGLTGWYSLKTALFASMVVSLLSLFTISFMAGRRIYANVWRQLFVSALEMSVGAAVILLKLAVGE